MPLCLPASCMSSSGDPKILLWHPPDLAGWLQMQGGFNSKLKRRYFILKGSMLFWFKAKEDNSPAGYICLDAACISAVASHDRSSQPPISFGLCIQIQGTYADSVGFDCLLLEAASEDSQVFWLNALQQASIPRPQLVAKLQEQTKLNQSLQEMAKQQQPHQNSTKGSELSSPSQDLSRPLPQHTGGVSHLQQSNAPIPKSIREASSSREANNLEGASQPLIVIGTTSKDGSYEEASLRLSDPHQSAASAERAGGRKEGRSNREGSSAQSSVRAPEDAAAGPYVSNSAPPFHLDPERSRIRTRSNRPAHDGAPSPRLLSKDPSTPGRSFLPSSDSYSSSTEDLEAWQHRSAQQRQGAPKPSAEHSPYKAREYSPGGSGPHYGSSAEELEAWQRYSAQPRQGATTPCGEAGPYKNPTYGPSGPSPHYSGSSEGLRPWSGLQERGKEEQREWQYEDRQILRSHNTSGTSDQVRSGVPDHAIMRQEIEPFIPREYLEQAGRQMLGTPYNSPHLRSAEHAQNQTEIEPYIYSRPSSEMRWIGTPLSSPRSAPVTSSREEAAFRLGVEHQKIRGASEKSPNRRQHYSHGYSGGSHYSDGQGSDSGELPIGTRFERNPKAAAKHSPAYPVGGRPEWQAKAPQWSSGDSSGGIANPAGARPERHPKTPQRGSEGSDGPTRTVSERHPKGSQSRYEHSDSPIRTPSERQPKATQGRYESGELPVTADGERHSKAAQRGSDVHSSFLTYGRDDSLSSGSFVTLPYPPMPFPDPTTPPTNPAPTVHQSPTLEPWLSSQLLHLHRSVATIQDSIQGIDKKINNGYNPSAAEAGYMGHEQAKVNTSYTSVPAEHGYAGREQAAGRNASHSAPGVVAAAETARRQQRENSRLSVESGVSHGSSLRSTLLSELSAENKQLASELLRALHEEQQHSRQQSQRGSTTRSSNARVEPSSAKASSLYQTTSPQHKDLIQDNGVTHPPPLKTMAPPPPPPGPAPVLTKRNGGPKGQQVPGRVSSPITQPYSPGSPQPPAPSTPDYGSGVLHRKLRPDEPGTPDLVAMLEQIKQGQYQLHPVDRASLIALQRMAYGLEDGQEADGYLQASRHETAAQADFRNTLRKTMPREKSLQAEPPLLTVPMTFYDALRAALEARRQRFTSASAAPWQLEDVAA